MKKFLSLVLALVMTMSLVTISAGAADFTDDSKVNYEEAVDVISTLKIVEGYPDGSFQPAKTLTRAEAAKIICNLVLGPTTASALHADTAPFKDVPADNWAAGYVAYCAQKGIINGYGDGNFGPTDPLTGYAYMKMLLVALGYDAAIEGYVGPNWSISVAKQALYSGLDKGLVDDFNGVATVTREEAVLYALNTLKAEIATYDTKGTSITVGDTVITAGASKAETDGTTFMDKYFTKLTKSDVNDDLKNTATRWMYKGKEIGTYAKAPDKVYTKKVASEKIYEDLGLVQTFNASVYEDGAPKAAFTVQEGDADTKIGNYGVTLNVYLSKHPVTDAVTGVKIVMINTYVGKVVDIDKNSDKERVVLLDTETDQYVTEEFEKDDIVLYTKDVTATPDAIKSMTVAEKKTGKLTKIVGDDDEFTIDGTTYKASKKAVVGGDVDVKDTVDFYLDSFGYLIKIDEAEDNLSVENLAYVETLANARGDYAVLRLADGTKKTVDTDKDYTTANGENLAHYIVSFKENSDGTYKLTKQSTAALSGNTTVDFANGKPGIDVDDDGTADIKTNSKTAFVYNLDNGDSYKTYTGYKNAAGITGTGDEKYVAYEKDGVAVMVYVELDKTDLANTAADLTVIAFDDGADVVDEGDGVTYYEFNAIVDSKITTVKVANTNAAWLQIIGDELCVSAGLTLDSDNIATAIAAAPGTVTEAADPAVLPVKNDIITIGGVALSYTDDVKVFFVDEDAEITAGTITSIRKDTNSGSTDPYGRIAYNVDSDGLVDLIVIVKK